MKRVVCLVDAGCVSKPLPTSRLDDDTPRQSQESSDSLRRAFRVDLSDYASQLSLALDTSDVPALQRLAHRIKGSASVYGFVGVSQAAALLENACQQAKPTIPFKPGTYLVETAHKLIRCCQQAAAGSIRKTSA